MSIEQTTQSTLVPTDPERLQAMAVQAAETILHEVLTTPSIEANGTDDGTPTSGDSAGGGGGGGGSNGGGGGSDSGHGGGGGKK